MNIKITHNWLKEYLETDANPEEIQKYLSLCGPSVERFEKRGNDYIYDIEVTSNRIDTASVYGIAREAAAILPRFNIKARLKPFQLTEPKKINNPLPLSINDSSHLCKRILAIVIDNVQVAPSPHYIRDRLHAANIRSLNNLVDITNYVMTEIGYPTHVFDYDRIHTQKFILRYAKQNEEIITLDKKKYHLNEEDIIIDDGTGRVIDLPGIMGTDNSVVTSKTKRVIFFMESNNPQAIRKSSLRYGIRTVAATINEKSPDPETAKLALLRGIDLFQKIAKGTVASNIIDLYPALQKIHTIDLSHEFINERIGVELRKDSIDQILKNLQFTIEYKTETIFSVTPPSYRALDITIPEDIVEEVARIYGYQNLPGKLQSLVYIKEPKESELLFIGQSKIKYFLKHLGLHEVMNYSMISKELIESYDYDAKKYLRLSNTISEEIEYMRGTLIMSLVKNCKDNEGKADELRFFEVAKTYLARDNDLPEENYKLGIGVNTNFADLKGILDALFRELNIEDAKIKKSQENSLFNMNAQGEIYVTNQLLGIFGELNKRYQIRQKLTKPVFLAQFGLQELIGASKQFPKYKPINSFATIKLDMTIDLKGGQSFQEIKAQSLETSKLLSNLELMSTFKNKLSLRFYFSSYTRNITEKEAKDELKKIEEKLK